MAVLECAAAAPSAMAVQPPQESEGIYLEMTPRKDVRVTVQVHPHLGFAVVWAEMGISWRGDFQQRHGSVLYGVRIPKRPLEGRLDLRVPGVASIVGGIWPVQKGLEFNGSFNFSGNGGYLSFDAKHATGGKMETVFCAGECKRPNPDLFEWISFAPEISGRSTQVLNSEGRFGERVSRFAATHTLPDPEATFEAQALEWLPGRVAVSRTIEVENAPVAAFKVSSKAERPKSATVRPPAPFSGSAHYEGVGSIRPAASGKLIGSLSADIYCVKIRLAGPRATASLINLNPGL